MNRSAKDRGLTFLARKLSYHNVTFFTAIILKEHRVLLQQDNQQSDDSQQMECEVLTDSGHTVEDSSEHSDTETTDGTVWGTDRQ